MLKLNIFNNYKKKVTFSPSKEILKLTDSIIERSIDVNFSGLSTIKIDRSEVGHKSERLHNIYGFARRNQNVKELVTNLTNNGFYLTHCQNGISTFNKFINAASFSKFIKKENLRYHRSIFYTLEKPLVKSDRSRLMVIFSSVAGKAYNSDVATRNFYLNFNSIQKYIPSNTYILRIADVGGVVGSFYLNNNFNEQVEDDIQSLISKISGEFSICHDDIVLYGTSKGGTGSLYHAILGQYKCVSVDPIITGEYHLNQLRDCHFVSGTFPKEKSDLFYSLLKNNLLSKKVNIIYSRQSPIFKEVEGMFNKHKESMNLFNFSHPKIKCHADVGRYSLNLLMLLINNLYYDVGIVSSKKVVN